MLPETNTFFPKQGDLTEKILKYVIFQKSLATSILQLRKLIKSLRNLFLNHVQWCLWKVKLSHSYKMTVIFNSFNIFVLIKTRVVTVRINVNNGRFKEMWRFHFSWKSLHMIQEQVPHTFFISISVVVRLIFS